MDETLANLVISLRKGTPDQIREAQAVLQTRRAAGAKLDLADVLLEQGVLDDVSARRLRRHVVRQAGPNIPGYQILEPLGGGGMGRVYAARHLDLDRLVALKVLVPDLIDDEDSRARFLREARAVGALDHPSIVKAYDVFPGDPAGDVPPYIAMEFIKGETLHALLQRVGRLNEARTLRIASAVADALDHAHRHGLVHRDIKPDNIMLTAKKEVKLCDLGLAKRVGQDQSITHAGMTHGTPHFMSPEQAQGRRDLDVRSDLYSLGCTMFRMAVGRPPFHADTAVELLMAHVEQAVPSAKAIRPELSIGFDRIVRKLMAKTPEGRYQYPSHLRTDLELVRSGEAPRIDYGVPYRPPETASRSNIRAAASSSGERSRDAAGPSGTADVVAASPSAAEPAPLRFVDDTDSGGIAAGVTGLDLGLGDDDVPLLVDDPVPRNATGRRKRRPSGPSRPGGRATGPEGGQRPHRKKKRRRRREPQPWWREAADGVRAVVGASASWLAGHRTPVVYGGAFVLVVVFGFVIATNWLTPASDVAPGTGDNGTQAVEPSVTEPDEPAVWRDAARARRALVESAMQAEADHAAAHAEHVEDLAQRIAEAYLDVPGGEDVREAD